MTVLQLTWLAAIGFAETAADWQKLSLLFVYSVLCGVVVWRLPERNIARKEQSTSRPDENVAPIIIALCSGVFLVGTVYAYVQVGWSDEQHVFAVSRIAAEQGFWTFFARYNEVPWLGLQHPPILPLLYGGIMGLLGVHLFILRLVSLLFSVGTLILTYAIGRELYDQRTGLRAALFLISTPFFFRLGAAAMTDMPTTFCFLLGLFLILRLLRAPTFRLATAAGLCIGIGLLCRYTLICIYPILLTFPLVVRRERQFLPYLMVVILVSGGILGVWLGYAAHSGILEQQWTVLSYSARFAKTAARKTKEAQWFVDALLFRLPSGIGLWNLPLLALGAWFLLRCRDSAAMLLFLWICATCLPFLLTVPAPRYFFPAFPALTIAMTRGLEGVHESVRRIIVLALLYGGGVLYLFVDWYRAVGADLLH